MVGLDQLMRLVEAESEIAWRDSLFDLASGLGFDSVLFGIAESKHTRLESSFVRSNYSEEWREHYNSHQLFYVDPTVTHCMGSLLPLVWSPQIFQAPNQRELYEEASSFGLRSGISFPIHGANGEVGLLSFSARERPGKRFDRQVSHHMADLSLVRDYAFQSSLQFLGKRNISEPAPQLSKRELEVFQLVLDGNSSCEIGRIMHRTEATINFHVSKIRQKFKVKTRQQAVVKGIALGILTP